MNRIRELTDTARERLADVADDPLLEVQVLLAHVLGRDRAWLYAWPEYTVPADQCSRFDALLRRRQAGHPIAHLTGRREFWSMPLRVDPATLIPRPETEQLVETVLALDLPDDARVLDLGTGSGAIALALAGERPGWRITALDRSIAALRIATANADERRFANVHWLCSDWFAALERRPLFDLIVSNPPYIAEGDPHLARGDVRFEPRSALVSGGDGLDDIRRIVAAAPVHLAPGGWLWLEHGYDQGDAVSGLLAAGGFSDVATHRDLAGRERHSGGRLPADRP